jgi:hypothetical protein
MERVRPSLRNRSRNGRPLAHSFPVVLGLVALSGAGWCFEACTSSGTTTLAPDSGGSSEDSGAPDTGSGIDSSATDAGPDAGPSVTGMTITTSNGVPLAAVPGTALPLEVVFTMSDGTTQPLPAGSTVRWIAPGTITTQNPDDAGLDDAGNAISVLPDGGAQPTAFYVNNPYRPDRTDYSGLLFVIAQGTVVDAGVTVTAALPDGGTISVVVPVGSAAVGDSDAGQNLFENVLSCHKCHGNTGDGSQPVLLTDGGLYLDDAGDPVFNIQGTQYPYPAPPLNNTYLPDDAGPNLGADPAWSAPLLGMAAQGDLDNFGVALRVPMPDWSKGTPNSGKPLTATDFADIYAWLRTQTQ